MPIDIAHRSPGQCVVSFVVAPVGRWLLTHLLAYFLKLYGNLEAIWPMVSVPVELLQWFLLSVCDRD